ncbi:MAG: hypothetical protein R2713_00490 [Ilumatobacteraceae bacterium]
MIEHQRRAAPPADQRRPPRAPERCRRWKSGAMNSPGAGGAGGRASYQVLRSMLADPLTDVAQVAVRLGLGSAPPNGSLRKLLTPLLRPPPHELVEHLGAHRHEQPAGLGAQGVAVVQRGRREDLASLDAVHAAGEAQRTVQRAL